MSVGPVVNSFPEESSTSLSRRATTRRNLNLTSAKSPDLLVPQSAASSTQPSASRQSLAMGPPAPHQRSAAQNVSSSPQHPWVSDTSLHDPSMQHYPPVHKLEAFRLTVDQAYQHLQREHELEMEVSEEARRQAETTRTRWVKESLEKALSSLNMNTPAALAKRTTFRPSGPPQTTDASHPVTQDSTEQIKASTIRMQQQPPYQTTYAEETRSTASTSSFGLSAATLIPASRSYPSSTSELRSSGVGTAESTGTLQADPQGAAGLLGTTLPLSEILSSSRREMPELQWVIVLYRRLEDELDL
jgi:hypothetical protein